MHTTRVRDRNAPGKPPPRIYSKRSHSNAPPAPTPVRNRALPRLLASLLLLVLLFIGLRPAAAEEPVLAPGDAVVTGFSGIVPSAQLPVKGANPLDEFFIDLDGPSAQIMSLRILGAAAKGQLATAPPMFQIKARDVGQVFAAAMNVRNGTELPDIFLAATSVYGIQIVRPDTNGDGRPERIMTGHPEASFMPGQFATGPGGTPGSIFRVDGTTGAVTLFATLPANSGPGIGDIAYDKANDQFFASDLDTGLVHRIAADGSILDRFDHGTDARPVRGLPAIGDDGKLMAITDPAFDSTDPSTWGYTQDERKVWGLAINEGRLYYAVGSGHQVWSVGIAADGAFAGDPRWEFDAEHVAGNGPVTDMLFDPDGRIYLAQRGKQRGSFDYSGFAEPVISSVVRYARETPDNPDTESAWISLEEEYAIGMPAKHHHANGGIALGYAHDESGLLEPNTCSKTLWSTGERLRTGQQPEFGDGNGSPEGEPDVHGLQGNDIALVRPQNVPPNKSFFIDYDGYFGDADKAGHLGDVEIWQPCEGIDFADYTPTDTGLPPGYLPPGDPPGDLPPEFVPPEYPYETNLRLTKWSDPDSCVAWGAGWACRYRVNVRNTGPDNYFGPLLVNDRLFGAPAGALMGFSSPGWSACWITAPSNYNCFRPATFLAPGASVGFTVITWVPNAYPLCHLTNVAEIEWAPGGSQWNTNIADDIDWATALIPAPHCPPVVEEQTNLRIDKEADPSECFEAFGVVYCRYKITVTNLGGIYHDEIHLYDEATAGTTTYFGAGPWSCAANGAGHDCEHPVVQLFPNQSVFLWAYVTVPADVATSNGCKIVNAAEITFASSGSNENTDPLDDKADATATVPAALCVAPAGPPEPDPKLEAPVQQCPPGYDFNGERCERRHGRCAPGERWDGETCSVIVTPPPSKTCPPGTVGRYPRCREIDDNPPPRCPRGTVGKYPDCRKIVRECAKGTVGKYPNCRKIVRECPKGTVGKYPNCRKIVRECPKGTVGKYPNCRKILRECPKGTVGKYPNCRKIVRACPRGTVGKFPNCRKVKKIDPPKLLQKQSGRNTSPVARKRHPGQTRLNTSPR